MSLFWVAIARAENTLLSAQSIRRVGSDMRLQIHFEQPMNYLSHFPQSRGSQVDVKLRPILSGANNFAMTTIEDSLNVSSGHGNPVQDIHYDQDESGNGILSVEFTKSYSFRVTQSSDHKTIYITLKNAMPGNVTVKKEINSTQANNVTTSVPIYVLNLQSGTEPIDAFKQPVLKHFRPKYDIYTIESRQGRKTIYQLRLGYFHSHSLAKEDLGRLKPFYPGAWLDQIKPERQQIAADWFMKNSLKSLEKRVAANREFQPKVSSGEKTKLSGKQAELLTIAKQALISKNYRKAVNYLTHILQSPDKTYHKESLELLGVARERQGLPAMAVAEYEKYLKLYPKGADAQRVRQRLNGLLTARAKPNAKLKQVVASSSSGPTPKWNFFGTFTQFYRNQQSKTNLTSAVTTANSVDTNLSMSGRRRGPEWNQRIDFAGTHRYDFLKNTNASNGTIYSLFYELSDTKDDFSMRIGRQTHNSDGVLGRFDGVILSKRMTTHAKVNFLAGYPVDIFLRDSINTNRRFYAGSIKFESLIKNLDTKFYYISQDNYGMTDRQAIGNETQYIDNSSQLFFVTDYDIHYKQLNQFTFVGNWRNKKNTNLNVVADYRKSPLLTTNNALIGQQNVPDLLQLRNTYSFAEVQQLARDRTATSKSLTVSASTQLGPKYQLSGDVNISDLTGTPGSGGVAATAGTGTQYYYNLSLIGMNMLSKSDVTILGMRYNTDVTSHTIMANFSSRLNLNKKWRVNPRMSIGWRDNDDGSKRITYTPRIITDYRGGRRWRYELELGYQKATTSNIQSVNVSSTSSTENYYIYLGYIHDF
jgi:tetratricopeptide (TPR) repeat protein